MSHSLSGPEPLHAGAAVRKAPSTPKRSRKSPLASPLRGQSEISDQNRRHLDPDELKAFFKSIPKTSFWPQYFYIQYFYGCRLSEPALIVESDVSFGRGVRAGKEQIVIKRMKKENEAAGYREVAYTADARVVECVKEALVCRVEGNPFLFASNRRRTTDDVGAERLSQLRNMNGWQAVSRFTAHRMFQQIAAAAKLPKHLRQNQVLRHTRAVVLLASGLEPEEVQHLLGHSSIKMTNRYIPAAELMRKQYGSEPVGAWLGA